MYAASYSSSYSSAGKLMSLVAACELAAGVFLVANPMPAMSAPAVVAMLGILGGSIFLLCRVTVPNVVRAPLLIALMATLMALSVHSDLLGLRKVSHTVSDASEIKSPDRPFADEPATTAEADSATRPRSSSSIRLQASGSDNGWAQRINDATARELGATDAGSATIRGYVSVENDAEGERLRVNWSVDEGADSASCGVLSVRVTNSKFALDQIARSFRTAIEQSAEAGGPRCN